MQSFASFQHRLLSIAFQYTHQVLLLHFQGLLSLQAQLLPFLVSTFFQSLSLSPGTFPLSIFLFPFLLHQLIQQYQWLSPFTFFCQLKLCPIFSPLLRYHTEHWYSISLSLLHFLLLLLGHVHTIFLCVLTHSSYKGPNRLSLLHCCAVSYILSEQISLIHLLSVAHFHLFSHIICTGDFHWSYWCDALHSLSWWPVSVQHMTMLLFWLLNHFWITITKFYPYQLSLAVPWQTVHAFSIQASSV